MPRYAAFLRAINVGGRVVKMDRLRMLFEATGFANVETFIASGNVVFEHRSKDSRAIARKIERCLGDALGYEVATFVRTDRDVAAIAAHVPFEPREIQAASAHVVGLLSEPLTARARQALEALASDIDRFAVNGREIYWLCRRKQSESTFSNAVFEKALGVRSTFRNMNTMARLAAKYDWK